MSEEKFKELFGEFLKVGDSIRRSQISYSLFARVAAGLENREEGHEEVGISMGKAWTEAAERFDRMIRANPAEAFDIALSLATLPVSADKKVENIQKWMRGDGPVMLSKDELRESLLGYLAGDNKADTFVEKLKEYISYDFSKINTKHDAFGDPYCFLSLATMLLGTKLQDVKGNENTERLFLAAEAGLRNPKVASIIDYYLEFEDTKWLAEELKSFEVK